MRAVSFTLCLLGTAACAGRVTSEPSDGERSPGFVSSTDSGVSPTRLTGAAATALAVAAAQMSGTPSIASVNSGYDLDDAGTSRAWSGWLVDNANS